jgi:muramoyltetrapeptide carboxypeptidase LdcA involved in peptidoglycan recycling
LQRALLGLRRAGWFEGVAGVVMGRLPQGPLLARSADDSPGALLYDDVLQACMGGLPCPVWVEADVGHVAPQWPWRQGGLASCQWDGEVLTLVQERG